MNKQEKKQLDKKISNIIKKITNAFEKIDKETGGRTNCICLIRQNKDDSWNTSVNMSIEVDK